MTTTTTTPIPRIMRRWLRTSKYIFLFIFRIISVHIFLYILFANIRRFSMDQISLGVFLRTIRRRILNHVVHSHWSYMVEQKDNMQITPPSSKLPSTLVTAGQYCGQSLLPLSKPSMHLLQ